MKLMYPITYVDNNEKPKIADIAFGETIGRGSGSKYMWYACPNCGSERWGMIRSGEIDLSGCKGCGKKYVRKLQKADIIPPKDEILRIYLEDKLTIKGVSKQVHVSEHNVRRVLRENNVEIRNSTYYQHRSDFASVHGMRYGETTEEHRAYMKWWRNLNREDYNKKRLAWARNFRERRTKQARGSYLKNKFGLTLLQYEEMLRRQDYKCLICGKPLETISDRKNRRKPSLHIDHNHETGKICALLCSWCNQGLGLFNENYKLLLKAARYLKDIKQTENTIVDIEKWMKQETTV